MLKAPIPYDEAVRLQYLYEYEILDTPEEDEFNEIVKLASTICQVPISLISLVDAGRQWFKAKVGVDLTESDRETSFCGHAMMNGEIFIIPDTTKDERFHDNPLVTGNPDIRFYAGVPLIGANGGRLGSLCVIDRKPQELGREQQEILVMLGKQVVKLMELHKKNLELKKVTTLERIQRKELERVAAMQKKMISIMAHDIRSPLSSLKSLLQLIPDKKNGIAQQAVFLEMAGNQLNTTLGLLDNLVDWGQLQLRGENPVRENCDVHALAKQVLKEAGIQAGMKGLTLRNGVDPSATLDADPNRVRFILRNLVNNAIKFTKTGSVGITASSTQERIRLTVEDSGIGMPPAILEQLFCGLKKVSRKGTQNETGSGLGLSLVREFVEKMEGAITAESTEGKGTRITVDLPRRYPQ